MVVYILIGLLTAVAVGATYLGWLYTKKSEKNAELAICLSTNVDDLLEAKELFRISSAECKVSQEKLQQMTELSVQKEVAFTKGLSALENSNVKMQELLIQLQKRDQVIKGLDNTVEFQKLQFDKLIGQKKSSEVRTGKIVEQVSPFLSDYPLNPRTARFIGDPIDFVHFDEDKVTFVEVKSGKSQLSTKQRKIRDLINGKKVEFIIYRISGNGPDSS